MKDTEKIEKFLEKSSVSSNSAVNKAVLNELTGEREKNKHTGKSLYIWRIIMKSPITKLAAAACVIIAVLIGVSRFGGSFNMTSKAFADVVEKVKEAGTISWITTLTSDEQESKLCKIQGH